ncbi:MAG: uroporphyrinogen decarboxylase family protein [Promethearchaeota archaeon]
MNSRDRVLTTLDHDEPDRVPLYEGAIDSLEVTGAFDAKPPTWGLRATMRAASRFPGWRRTFKWAMGRAFVIKAGIRRLFKLYGKAGLDLVATPAAFLLTKCRFPTWDTFVDEFGRAFKIDVFNGSDQMVYEGGYFDPSGWWWASKRERKFLDAAVREAGVPAEDDVAVARALYEAWGLPDPEHRARVKNVRYGLQLAGDDILPAVAINGVVESTWESFGFELFSKMLYKDKQFASRVFEDRARFSLEVAKLAMDEGAEVLFLLDDLAYKGRAFLSPRMMRTYVYPHLKTVVGEAHRRGVKVLLHSCGDITDIFGDLLDVGFDAVNPIEPTAGMDIFSLKREYGSRVTFIGNVSPQELATGSPDDIRAYTRRLIREVAPGGGFILSSGHSINPYVRRENYLAMLEVAREYGVYPIRK